MEYQIPFVMKEHLNNIYEHFIAQDISSYFHLSQGEYSRKYFFADRKPAKQIFLKG